MTAAQARERERKLIARKERNRASAAAHRERKNATIDELTVQVNKLQEENRRRQEADFLRARGPEPEVAGRAARIGTR